MRDLVTGNRFAEVAERFMVVAPDLPGMHLTSPRMV
jgi:hypothetical protein